MVRATALIALAAMAGTLSACEVRHAPQRPADEQPSQQSSLLESRSDITVPGNADHNAILKESPEIRAYSLAEAIKATQGIARCSGERTLYRGADKRGTAYWALQCHTGDSFMVSVPRKGRLKTMPCTIAGRDIVKCWKTFDEERAEQRRAAN